MVGRLAINFFKREVGGGGVRDRETERDEETETDRQRQRELVLRPEVTLCMFTGRENPGTNSWSM